MKIIGVTGASGAGKSKVSSRFAEFGIPVLDTDRVARQITEKGQPALIELVQAFGAEILDGEGNLRRHYVAEMVFGEPDVAKKAEKQATLNAITHKYVTALTDAWLTRERTGGCPVAVLDVPLLFESGMDKICDITIGVVADTETKLTRIMHRDSISREMAEHRLSVQHPDSYFAEHCTTLIDNSENTVVADLDRAIMAILKELQEEKQ